MREKKDVGRGIFWQEDRMDTRRTSRALDGGARAEGIDFSSDISNRNTLDDISKLLRPPILLIKFHVVSLSQKAKVGHLDFQRSEDSFASMILSSWVSITGNKLSFRIVRLYIVWFKNATLRDRWKRHMRSERRRYGVSYKLSLDNDERREENRYASLAMPIKISVFSNATSYKYREYNDDDDDDEQLFERAKSLREDRRVGSLLAWGVLILKAVRPITEVARSNLYFRETLLIRTFDRDTALRGMIERQGD
uniref:Uncharacterized protein n=1 Tax=Vespula pensylvanica TaxID=30213 RepID=A0A834P430_VESPE|nr:hypothetical protein H0235_007052 [Vespula pensylvanica]